MNFFEAMEALKSGHKVIDKRETNETVFSLVDGKIYRNGYLHDISHNWEIYKEPKPKVKRWKWRIKYNYPLDKSLVVDSSRWFTKEEVVKYYKGSGEVVAPWAGPEEFDE